MDSQLVQAIGLKYHPVALIWADKNPRMPCSLPKANEDVSCGWQFKRPKVKRRWQTTRNLGASAVAWVWVLAINTKLSRRRKRILSFSFIRQREESGWQGNSSKDKAFFARENV